MKYAITIRKNKTGLEIILNRFVVPRTRLELTRANAHHPLKVACLTNSTTWASIPAAAGFQVCKYSDYLFSQNIGKKKKNCRVTKLTRQFDVVFEACGGPGSVRHGCVRKTVYSAKSISSKR